MSRTGHWMQTFTGVQYYPYDPRPEDFNLEDIAHALSMLCRFNGHSDFFYSVAQHSTVMSTKVSKENRLWALFHDAAEAYLGDLIRPVKRGSALGIEFSALEDHTLSMIAERFDLPWPIPDEIHEADNRMLATEARDVLGGQVRDWNLGGAEPYTKVLVEWTPQMAKTLFLHQYDQILKGVS